MRAALLLALCATPAAAHQAPSGWTYPLSCCTDKDCAQVPAKIVRETPQGYALPSGERLRYSDPRILPSPDGKYHWCVNTVGTHCLFVPPKAF